jgi:hypothetical protein
VSKETWRGLPSRLCFYHVLSPAPWVIDFQLETLHGTRITPSSGAGGANAQFVMSEYASDYRCALPVLPANAMGSHEVCGIAVLNSVNEEGPLHVR